MSQQTQNLRDNVKRGAAWLDRNYPGWAERINVETLALSNSCDCVLGQVSGEYQTVVQRMAEATSNRFQVFHRQVPMGGLLNTLLRRTKDEEVRAPIPNCNWPAEHGFDFPADTRFRTPADRIAAYRPLGDLWIEEIANRVHPVNEVTEASLAYGEGSGEVLMALLEKEQADGQA